jgi:hypothetical protein
MRPLTILASEYSSPRKPRVFQSKCHLIKGPDLLSLSLAKKYSPYLGVYFDGSGLAVRMSAAEAGMSRRDAIFSVEPGQLAIFFFPEDWAWHCESK